MKLINQLNKIPTPVYVIGTGLLIFSYYKIRGAFDDFNPKSAGVGVVNAGKDFVAGVAEGTGVKTLGENINDWLVPDFIFGKDETLGTFTAKTEDELRQRFNASIDGGYGNPINEAVNKGAQSAGLVDEDETIGTTLADTWTKIKAFFGDEVSKNAVEYLE